ncbi:MAG TPA: hypothetical protein VIW23_11635 [Candidatus Acidoferrum sp.]
MKRQLLTLSTSVLCAAMFASPAYPQRPSGGFGTSGRGGAAFSRHGAAVGHRFGRMHHSGRGFPGYGFAPNYYPYYYSDYDYDGQEGIGEAPPPAPVLTQPAAPAPPANAAKPADSVVMELRGDRWVRLTSSGPMEIQAPALKSPAFERSQAPSELPPAVLVFRDGHQEEAAKYTIVGRTIFVKADYWSSGSWTREVPISDLDLAATRKVNEERGTKFSLPSRSGEVIFRP